MEVTVEKNPLISLYQALDKSATRRLGKWMDSPIHNKREDVRALHAYLTGGDERLFKTSSLSKMRIWKRIFLKEPFEDARLRQTFHWALRATEAFIAYEEWADNKIETELALTTGLRRRGLSSNTLRSLKKARQLQERSEIRNETFYRRQYALELEYDEYRVYHKLMEKPNFQEIADALDVAYLIEKFKVSCNMLFHSRVYKTSYDVRFLKEIISFVNELNLEDYPVLAIYYYVYLGFTEDDERGNNVLLLRDTITAHGDLLTATDHRYIILMAINICISNMNVGREAYIREAFEWYRLGFARDVIAENNLLTRATYLNIITIGLRLQEYDWIQRFIDTHTNQLEDDIRENTESFARARLAYEQKDYNTGMPLLAQVDFKHPVYNIMAKTLQLKIYYEIDEYDAMDSQLDSMTTYLRRKTLSDLHKDNFGNIVRFVRRVSRLAPGDRKKKAELREQIENATPLTEKKWLLEQLDKR